MKSSLSLCVAVFSVLCVFAAMPERTYAQSYPAYPYQYGYALTCAPSYQTVTFGQTAHFTAYGGSGTYSWSTPGSTYPGVGAVFNTTLRNSGVQVVTVTSGSQTAVCTVNSVPSSGAVSYTTALSPFVPVVTVPTTYVAQYVPSLPNTGFEPIQITSYALAFVVVLAAGIFVFPYVRRAFATILA